MLPSLTLRRASELIARFASQPILVVGDVMVDRFIVGRVRRISPEAPVPVVHFELEYTRLGGAANVANNIASLGGRASLVGVIGVDAAGARLREQLDVAGIDAGGLVHDPARPTTEKVRIVTDRHQQVARIDYERDADIGDTIEAALIARAEALARGAKALLVSDYLKGTITRPIVEALLGVSMTRRSATTRSASLSGERVPLLVDPKIPHLAYYAGATLITPNHHEAEAATQLRIRSDDDAREAARDFRARAKCDAVLITRGEHGMWLSDTAVAGSIPAIAREVSDVTGAGDTVVATLALALAAGATMTEAAILANYAAGTVVGKFGPATVTGQELLASLKPEV